MPYSEIGNFDPPYEALNGLRFCACGEPCTVRVRGARWDHDINSKWVPCHRWLCEQCYQNLLDDDATLRIAGRQRMTEEQEAVWDQWYDKHGHTL